MIDNTELSNRFDYHPPRNESEIKSHEDIREQCRTLALHLNLVLPDSREKSLAITHLEEVMLWSNAAIARNKE